MKWYAPGPVHAVGCVAVLAMGGGGSWALGAVGMRGGSVGFATGPISAWSPGARKSVRGFFSAAAAEQRAMVGELCVSAGPRGNRARRGETHLRAMESVK